MLSEQRESGSVQQAAPQPSRRRLLRGAAAAPVVLTISPGAALAGSSYYACIARNKNVAEPLTVKPAVDTWYRVEVTAYAGTNAETGNLIFSYPNVGTWYRIVAGVTNPSANVIQNAGSIAPSYDVNTASSRFLLRYFNNKGDDLGFIRPATGFAEPVSGSCWTSFSVYKAQNLR